MKAEDYRKEVQKFYDEKHTKLDNFLESHKEAIKIALSEVLIIKASRGHTQLGCKHIQNFILNTIIKDKFVRKLEDECKEKVKNFIYIHMEELGFILYGVDYWKAPEEKKKKLFYFLE